VRVGVIFACALRRSNTSMRWDARAPSRICPARAGRLDPNTLPACTRRCELRKPHAYLLRVACCSVCMAACRAAVHLATVDVCAIRSRKILSCGLPAAGPYAPKLARIMSFCSFPGSIASQTEGGEQQLKMPCLLCLLFYDALSHHAYVFLLVSVNLETDLPTQEEMPAQEEMPPHEEMPTP